LEDEELIIQYKSNQDLQTLTDLYKPYMTLIYGSCLKYLKDQGEAEDAVMDIYEKIAKKILTSDIQSFKAWIYMVTRNHCFEVLRRRGRKIDKETDPTIMYSMEVFHPDTDHNEVTIAVLRQCLNELEDFQKSCVEMFYYKKMSYVEIAEQLEVSYNQIRSRIQNGRRNLKVCMDKNQSKIDADS
jgi:RNA polymerase sigma factor (sigma-70 family)